MEYLAYQFIPMLALLLLVPTCICDCQKQIFYIRPSDSSHCPREVNTSQCYDLSTLVSEGHLSMALTSSLLFLPGDHFLEQDLEVNNTKEFHILPWHDFGLESGITIACTGHSLRVQNVSFVEISSISFQSCGVDVENTGVLQLRSVDHSEISNCKWYDSRSSAIFIEDSNTIVSDCQFLRGSCSNCSGGGIHSASSNVTFTGSNVVANNSVLVRHGGGLSLTSSTVLVDGNLTVDGNLASSVGGGIFVENCIFGTTNTSYLLVKNNKAFFAGGQSIFNSQCTFNGYVGFFGNSAEDDGGGMAIYDNSNCTFSEYVEFSDNHATNDGGGMLVIGSHCTFNGYVDFSGNNANHGGGMEVIVSYCTFNEPIVFTGNSAVNGGGMEVNYVSQCTFNGHAKFAGNSATNGGGMLVIGALCTFNGLVEFSGNNANYNGGGIEVLASFCTFNEPIQFSGNNAFNGGGMVILYDSQGTVNGNVSFSGNDAINAGGGMLISTNVIFTFNGQVDIFGNSASYGGGLVVYDSSQCTFSFSSVALFSGNSARKSGGSLVVGQGATTIFLSLVTFSANSAAREGGSILAWENSLLVMSGQTIMKDNHASSYGGAMSLDFSELRMKGNSQITNNSAQYGGAIQAISSKIHFISGDHYFENNSAQYGGGWSLVGGASIYVPHNLNSVNSFTRLNIHFVSNSAIQYGGAIWVENTPYYSCTLDQDIRCFFRGEINNEDSPWQSDPPRITTLNNTATIAGGDIYGGNIDNCINDMVQSTVLSTVNSMSSDPNRVCLCNYTEPDCSISNLHTEIFSGQQLQLTLVGVGQRNSAVPAVIVSHTDPPGSSNDGSVTQSAPGSCTVLSYTITSDKPSVKLTLYPESLCDQNSLHMLIVHVKIKPCPPGFMLQNETKSCTCNNTLTKLDNSIQCDIDSQSFSHQHGVWIGYNQLNKNVIYHPHCPFDYCKQELSTFTLNGTDDQCRYNRSGLICGACNDGYSLTLGGSKCKECSHVYLALFLPLALAGVVLVLFLLTFKLTVSVGAINGLIFFANIIGTNSSIFLPPENTVVLRVFIAWLNLDLGINTCLFDGLDMYIKVWLQFVFPFYVFALIGITIFVSHRSTLVTKLLGSDPVAVLATLILLAYTKLLRTVLTVMSFTYIQGFDGSSIAVWLYDGNVRYLSGKHIPLFTFALLIMLLLIIPYTVILLFGPYLQRYSKNRVLFWINDYRIKPFLHSYYAPLKDKYRSWIGLLLALRLCLLIVFVSNSLGDPSINLFAIATAVFFLLCWRVLCGTFYNNWFLDALELFLIMKLGLFSVATLYVLNTSGSQRALNSIFLGMTFIVFIAITAYHIWRKLTDSRWWRLTLKPKWQKYLISKNKITPTARHEAGDEREPHQLHKQVSSTVVELREPVLDYC